MTPADIEQGRRLVEAATPGEWDTGSPFEENYLYAGQTHLACLASSDISDHYLGDDSEAIANTRFIVWAKNNLPALLDAYEAAVAENARLREGLEREYEAARIGPSTPGLAIMAVIRRVRTLSGGGA